MKEGVGQVAALARLPATAIDEAELTSMLAFAEQIAVATDAPRPTFDLDPCPLADDQPAPSLEMIRFVANAPEIRDGQLVVPAVTRPTGGSTGSEADE